MADLDLRRPPAVRGDGRACAACDSPEREWLRGGCEECDPLWGTTFHRVSQTRTGAPAGNCTEAALASVLGCAIDEVPQLWSGDLGASTELEAQPEPRRDALLDWLNLRGLVWLEWRFAEPQALPLPAGCLDGVEGWVVSDMPHFMSGPNPDGVSHMVVGQAGRLLWDPNPLRRGIAHVERISQLQPAPGGA